MSAKTQRVRKSRFIFLPHYSIQEYEFFQMKSLLHSRLISNGLKFRAFIIFHFFYII